MAEKAVFLELVNECFVVYAKISDYLEDKEDDNSAYITMMFNKLNALAAAMGI